MLPHNDLVLVDKLRSLYGYQKRRICVKTPTRQITIWQFTCDTFGFQGLLRIFCTNYKTSYKKRENFHRMYLCSKNLSQSFIYLSISHIRPYHCN